MSITMVEATPGGEIVAAEETGMTMMTLVKEETTGRRRNRRAPQKARILLLRLRSKLTT